MAAPGALRVRLLFDFPPPAIPQSCMFWFLLDRSRYRVVADLASVIRERFFYDQRGGLSLYVEECLLPPGESVLVVRDNDCIKVKWDGGLREEDLESTTRIVHQRKKSRKKRRETCDEEDGEDGDSGTRKSKKPRRRSLLQEDPGSGKTSEEKTNGCVNVNGSAKRPTKRQKRHLTEKTDTEETRGQARRAPEDIKTSRTSSRDRSESRPTAAPPTSVSAKAKASTAGPDSRSSTSQKTLCSSSSDSSDSDNLVIKKPLTGAHPLNKNSGRSLLLEKVQEGPLAHPPAVGPLAHPPAVGPLAHPPAVGPLAHPPAVGPLAHPPAVGPLAHPPAVGHGVPRGRGECSWRRQRGHFLRVRGGIGNCGRGRGNHYYHRYDADAQKQQNESVPNPNPPAVGKRDYGALPLLAAPPQPGRVIVFKLIELSENYSPEVSDYKEGRVLSYDPLTEQLELEILSYQTKEKEPGKFDLVYEAEDGTNIVEYAVPQDTRITQRWSSLIEPRLIMEAEGVTASPANPEPRT